MENPKIEISFENRILSVKFHDNVIVDTNDLEEIYTFGNERSKGNPYCIIFEAINHYEVTEDAIRYMIDNPHNKNILAKAYVINTKEAERKAKLHLVFDNPELKPGTFKTKEEALDWLKTKLINEYNK